MITKFTYIFATAFLYYFICPVVFSVPFNGNNLFALSIIHFSDFHSRYVQVSPAGGLCYESAKDKCVGGIARVSTIVNRLKEIRPNPIFLNAGDCFQGTLYYAIHRFLITSYFMNKLPHDVMTIGNHDFDDSLSGLKSYVNQLKAPVVVTNIDSSDEPSIQNLFLNSTIIRKGDKDIGVIGVIFSDTDKISSTTGKLKFLNEVETVNLEAKKLKSKGVNIIIVLSHCGIDHDKILANNCPDIDVIVGGHSHILLYNGKPPSNEAAYGEYPIVINQTGSNRKVLIVHASAFTKYMGDLQVVFDDAGEVTHWKGNPIYLDQTIEEDSKIIEELKPWKKSVDRIGKVLIGHTLAFLNGSCDTGECTLANLITDAMVDQYANEAIISLTTADSIQNSIPIGPIVYEDIYMSLPYNNTWDLIELKGSDLRQVLEENVAGSSDKQSFQNSRLILWSGLKVVYNLTDEHTKVRDVKVRCLHCQNNNFETLDEDKWYRIVVPAYLLTEDFEIIFKKHKNLETGTTTDVENLIHYIKKIKDVHMKIESRMIFV